VIALSCPGIHEAFGDNDTAEIKVRALEIMNLSKNLSFKAQDVPEQLIELALAGGIRPLLRSKGLLK
jgi:hypothetical protein